MRKAQCHYDHEEYTKELNPIDIAYGLAIIIHHSPRGFLRDSEALVILIG